MEKNLLCVYTILNLTNFLFFEVWNIFDVLLLTTIDQGILRSFQVSIFIKALILLQHLETSGHIYGKRELFRGK